MFSSSGFIMTAIAAEAGVFMKIRLVDLKEGVPMPVQEQYEAKPLDIEFVDLHYTEPLKMEGVVEKGPDTLTFQGHIRSATEITCGRCLKKSAQKVDKPFTFYYEIKGKEEIETIDDLREVLILDHSLVYLCKESCRGLCPKCGTNLNETSCKCKTDAEPLSSSLKNELKKIWSKKREE